MIETARLILQRHVASDFEEIHLLWNDPLVIRNISQAPCSRSDARSRLLRYAGQWALDGWGFFAVRTRETGAYVGEVGFLSGYRDIEPRMDGAAEMGWVMGPDGRGNGMALEAVTAALDWADQHIERTDTKAMILPENAPSQRLAAQVGFRFSHTAMAGEQTLNILSRPRGG